ncbi:hypothetical protein F8G81_21535 [Arthrobacter sp. CDRTa11]|uniref:hypothetical protein n=1 Tax=Arthrobacter sp. CDRTa11 TaxID=2651199 RepID=UPI002265AA67|nr:hypothetical protein [Arthrobacter sp. CDRTa11]UZX04889.1 hypothetical protein F8G81_21535 [Arthrobacter sp. CDRTa11]
MSDTAGSRTNGTVDQLLLEAELDDDGALRPVLLELQALGANQPEPSAAVAALMAPATARLAAVQAIQSTAALPAVQSTPSIQETSSASTAQNASLATTDSGKVTDELAARRRAKRRIALTTLSVAVSLAAGGAVAAASDQGVRDSFGQLNQAVTSFVSTMGAGPATKPAQVPAPASAQPGKPASTTPAEPTAPVQDAKVPETEATHGAEHDSVPGPSAKVTIPEVHVPDNITPAVPGGPLHGEGNTPALPLPATPPVPLPGHTP